ncbi:MAG: L,D-transpeptidase family protein [Alphaproteobacteria bacterium]|nr:L,D-transpeptidase family protein [Alphaproteobacteria bacterium]
MNRRAFIYATASGLVLSGQFCRQAYAQLVNKPAEKLGNGEFNWFPERSPGGPLLIIVSIPDQLVHVYRNGIRIAASTCSTGKPGHSTPTGVFKILQKDKHHRSSTYNNAPMPNMNRLTWSGVALHAGNLPGYPASHGCVRLPLKFSELLFGITKLGMTVVIADRSSQPAAVVHPGMVLGDYARREFAGVDVSLKRAQYSEGQIARPHATSVVVSGRDRTMTIWDNDRIVASGKVDIDSPHKPVAEGVHKLVGSNQRNQELHWTSVGHEKPDREDLARELRRIKAEPRMKEELRKRMHHGMTVVTTNESSNRFHQSQNDFVVIDGIY